MICREGWFQKKHLRASEDSCCEPRRSDLPFKCHLRLWLPASLWLWAVSVYKSRKVSTPPEGDVRDEWAQSCTHEKKVLRYVTGSWRPEGKKLIRALSPFPPKRQQQIQDKGKTALPFPTCLPFMSVLVKVLQMPGRRLRRPLVKMQNSASLGGISWWKDWNQATKLNLKVLSRKEKRESFIFPLFNRV